MLLTCLFTHHKARRKGKIGFLGCLKACCRELEWVLIYGRQDPKGYFDEMFRVFLESWCWCNL